MPFQLPADKAEFSLEEAAAALGLSADELRFMVAERLAGDDEVSAGNLARMRFRPADLIMLEMVRRGAESQKTGRSRRPPRLQ